eukprot:m.13896 g.13896  ORF g.13896 m.13896 type:complete len:138 (+) comp25286_c0_seq1:902-1315(+)
MMTQQRMLAQEPEPAIVLSLLSPVFMSGAEEMATGKHGTTRFAARTSGIWRRKFQQLQLAFNWSEPTQNPWKSLGVPVVCFLPIVYLNNDFECNVFMYLKEMNMLLKFRNLSLLLLLLVKEQQRKKNQFGMKLDEPR